MVTTLVRKLMRDLARMRGQAVTIALVVACGIASYVTLQSAYASLLGARDAAYESGRLADVFVHLKRAPNTLLPRIEAIPGVAVAETRVVETVMLPMDDLALPATGKLVGLPGDVEPRLNAVFVREGRLPQAGYDDEVALLESFAKEHHLKPGSTLPAVINGTRRELRVVGIAMSPEYVFALPIGGVVADNARSAVLWMDRAVVGPAFQLDGAFDDVVVGLQPGASARGVVDQLDALLEPYGGLGAVLRDKQPSNFVVSNELTQLKSFATLGPIIFLTVAAFLVNVVLSRVVILQRPQIATLKALGYTNREIGLHYLELVLVVVAIGALAGVGLGAILGRGMLSLYQRYFQFPSFDYHLDPRIVGTSVAVSLVAGAVGAFTSVRRVVALAPAEAMLPEAPPTYRPSFVERIGLGPVFSAAARMVLRDISRRPARLALSCLGIALGVAVVVSGSFMKGAFDVIVGIDFETARRDDVTVAFTRVLDISAVRELTHVEGVLSAEGLRTVPVRIRSGRAFRDVPLIGHPPHPQLRRVVEWPIRIVSVPDEGLLLTDVLADRLGVGVGDSVSIEVLEGDRRTRTLRVAATVREMFGLNAHMSMRALDALLDETDGVSMALLTVDPRLEDRVDAELKKMPSVAAVSRRRDTIAAFNRQATEQMHTTSLVLTIFGAMIAVGVVYNNARVALSTRARDLASLRVLGFTRREISAVLLGELATYVVLGLAPGLFLGKMLARWMMSVADPEMYRMPAVVTQGTYVFAAAITTAAAIGSALVVRRQLDHLDLVAVLKARE